MQEMRRISHDLRPAILDDLGLAAALDHLAQEFSQVSAAAVRFHAEGSADGLSEVANTVLFRIAQEALTNIERHAEASHIDITLARAGRRVSLTVRDDGVGFDAAGIASHPKRGIGLRNMLERMEAIGGTLAVTSSPSGTTVLAAVEINHD
jgi:two-component system NarL family sensor kinase